MSYHNIEEHDFFKTVVLNDEKLIREGRNFSLSDIYLEDAEFTEFEYYIHTTGFYLVHFIKFCDQLSHGIDLLSNYNYKSNSQITRIDHLTYNLENYIVRLASLKDRMFQLINATFHLCIDERDVSERVVLKNMHVSRTQIPTLIKIANGGINKYTGERNTIVHRHSYLNKELKRLEIFYNQNVEHSYSLNNNDKLKMLKSVRTESLKNFLSSKKTEFSQLNQDYFDKIIPILDLLLIHYEKMKLRLQ